MRTLADKAVEVLRGGGLVAIPTETVYGLAGDASNELAVRRIFGVKGRPASHPVIVHLHDQAQLKDWAREVPEEAEVLAHAFWPGPLTFVLKRQPRVLDVITGGQDTVALRVPAHPEARAILKRFGGGLAAPSANRFGRVSPTTAAHVREDLGNEVDLIVDGGPCSVGVESTIVDLTGSKPALLRPGGTAKERIEEVLGHPLAVASATTRAPGMLASHYAPKAGLVLCEDVEAVRRAAEARAGQKRAVLAPEFVPGLQDVQQVALPKDDAGTARILYALLRQLDVEGVEVIIALLPSANGLGLAVRDRLMRASVRTR